MIVRFLFYGSLFLLLATVEGSFLSGLGTLGSAIPLVPIVAIWLYHQWHSRIGIWYLVAWGIYNDLFAQSLWVSLTLVGMGMTLIMIYTSQRLFSQRSLYGLESVGLVCMFVWVLFDALARFFTKDPLSLTFDHFGFDVLTHGFFLLLGLALLFLVELHYRPRSRRL